MKTREQNIAQGKVKQARGKANDVVGAATGNLTRQMKGKIQKVVGKAQVAIGRHQKRTPGRGR